MENEEKLLAYLKRATADLRETRQRLREAESRAREPVAIVGMSCRFPGGVSTPEEFLELALSERDAIGDFPVNRGWDIDRLRTASDAQSGGFLYQAADFDPSFFGISPRESVAMDPQQRLLLETSWEAIESARIDPTSLRGTATGVFAGVIYHDYGARLRSVPDEVAGYVGNGSDGAVATGRVAYTLGLQGPAVSLDTACSSSLVALHLAVQSLRRGECAMALAGGVTVMSSPTTFVELSRQGALSPDGRCKAFGAGADGTGWGEGVGMLLLERLSDAEQAGHRVLAVIRGSAVNQDGTSSGLTAPNGPAQQRVIRQALADSGLAPSDVDAVEAHGTGTALGDPIEAQALLATYGAERDGREPVWLGSVKSNIGHTQAAAGVAGVIKMVQAIRAGVLPATLHADPPSPHIDWSLGGVRLLTERREWPRTGAPRRAAVSSFGISGTNAHLIVEQAPQSLPDTQQAAPDSPPLPIPWVLSAKTAPALASQARRLADHVTAHAMSPEDVSHSLATTRARLEHRAVVVGTGQPELVAGLRALASDEVAGNVVQGVAGGERRVVFVFPGQGSQWPGMAVDLMDRSPVFASWLARCGDALAPYVDWNLHDVLHGVPGAPDLDRVDVVQPALWAVMVSLAEMWRAYGVEPDAVVGHSQGEVAAACVAGALSLEDGARVIALRSRAVRTTLAGRGGMMVVPLPADDVHALLRPYGGELSLAALNGPSAMVVSGTTAALERLKATGVDARTVKVDYAAHSAQVEALRETILAELAPVRPQTARVPFHSTVTGEEADTTGLDAEYWYSNLREPVRFDETVRGLIAQGYGAFVEMSPHPVLTVPVEEIAGETGRDVVAVGSLRRGQGGLDRLHLSLAQAYVRGVPVTWASPSARSVDLPTYPFQRERFWLDAGTEADVSAAGLLPSEHPFLAAELGLAGSTRGAVFTGRLSLATHPWLAGHAAAGTVLLPGTAFVELALWAGAELGCPVVAELTVTAPLPLPEHAAVAVQVAVGTADDDGRRPVSVHSRPADSEVDAPWTRHASGTLAPSTEPATTSAPGTTPESEAGTPSTPAAVAGAPATAPEPDLTDWPPPNARPIPIDGLYDRLATEGYAYGPAFQGLRKAWRRGDDLFAEVVLPTAAGGPGAFALHPALLDAALHADLLREATGPGVRLPFAWRDVVCHAVQPAEVRVHLATAGPDATRVRIADAMGAPVLSIGSLVSMPVTHAPPTDAPLYRIDLVAPVLTGPVRPLRVAALGPVPGLHLPDEPGADLVFTACPTGDDAESARAATHHVLGLVQRWLADARFPDARLVVVGAGADPSCAAAFGLVRSAQSEHPGRFVILDVDGGPVPLAPVLAAAGTDEPTICVRDGAVLVPRIVRATADRLTVPSETPYWRLDATGDGDLDGLTAVPHPAAGAPLEPHQVRVSIRAAGVNFRDVVVALGMVSDRGVPLGGEAAGVVLETGSEVTSMAPGDRVMGLLDGAFGPVGVTDHRLLTPVPDGWSFRTAASVPGVFLTAYHGLVRLAGLRAGEKVLIHAAAGGVGMAAVQLARHLGAEVFATASPAKWDALRGLGLDDDHIASSRDLDFAQKFQGLDVVLNSLAAEFIDASLQLLCPGGRFVELGKTDLRDPADHPDVRYLPFDLLDIEPDQIQRMSAELLALFDAGALRPLPVRTWDVRQARTAFRFMAAARNIGKIVLTLPDPDGTVLVTGGTGLLGRLTARHLVTGHGVRHLLLTTRNADLVGELTELGASVTVAHCDVSDRAALAALLAGIPPEHPLTGVVHAAGALDDGLVESLTEDRIDRVWRPKADAAWHLHELTAHLDLSMFTLYSSAAGVLGGAGQANYAAANAFLDALAAHRHAQGKVASSIAWGLWGRRSGMSAHLTDQDVARTARSGLPALTDVQGMALFDAALTTTGPLHVAVPFDLPALRAQGEHLPALLRGLVRTPLRQAAAARSASGGETGLRERLADRSPAEQRNLLAELVRTHAAAILGHTTPDAVDDDRAFRELGLDSLTAVELRNRLAAATGLRLPATLAFDHANTTALARHLLTELRPPAADPTGSALAGIDRLDAALAELTESGGDRTRIAARLQALLRRWDDVPREPGDAHDLVEATDEEIFAALDNELGIA
ncbi:type I polyketide synthase [Streptomyces sp. NPDC051987]|uniref:type I polyketide synthase n=1 Tax=Streptomyces sp. NPDC051987 TaxID=3155808 RepID=UPI00341B5076